MQLCKMKNINAIIFDLGVVILNINYQNTINELKKIGIKNTSSFYSRTFQTKLFDQIETGKISTEEFLIEIQKKTSSANIKQVKDAWNAMLLDLPKKRIELLKKLNENYPIFLLSNTNALHISKFKEKIGRRQYTKFYNLFKKVYYSHEIGLKKPDDEAFKIIINENNLDPHKVLFIDDSIQHIRGARNLGIKTHHMKENEDITTLFSDITL